MHWQVRPGRATMWLPALDAHAAMGDTEPTHEATDRTRRARDEQTARELDDYGEYHRRLPAVLIR